MKALIIDHNYQKPEYALALEKSCHDGDLVYTNDPSYAIELLSNQIYDVIITEIILSGTDGFEIIRSIREDHRHDNTTIFVVSNLSTDVGMRKAFSLGADHYMIKPVNVEIFVSRVIESQQRYCWSEYVVSQNTREIVYDPEDLDVYIPDVLKQIGVPLNLLGFKYMAYGIRLSILEPYLRDYGITKGIYPRIAKEYNTTSSRVERGIRNAIERTWKTGCMNIISEIFGNSIDPEKGKPTNNEFICCLSDYVKRQRTLYAKASL